MIDAGKSSYSEKVSGVKIEVEDALGLCSIVEAIPGSFTFETKHAQSETKVDR